MSSQRKSSLFRAAIWAGLFLILFSGPGDLSAQARIYGVRHPDGGSRITVLPDMDGDGIKDYVVARFLPELRASSWDTGET